LSERADRLRTWLRLAAWALALGLFAAIAQAFVALAVREHIERVAALCASEVAQAAAAQAALLLLLALSVLALSMLGALAAQLPTPVGAGAGLVAALLPPLVLALGEGAAALGPAQVAAVRAAGFVACAAAGATGVRLGGRLARGFQKRAE
jgi:hypothetical protein